MLQDNVKPSGSLSLEFFSSDGLLLRRVELDNLVVSSGLAWLADRCLGNGQPISHVGVGGSSSAAAASNTGLFQELGRGAVTQSLRVTTAVSNDTLQYTATLAPGVGTGSLTEAGLFTAASGGTMVTRTTFAAQAKISTETLVITWKIRFL